MTLDLFKVSEHKKQRCLKYSTMLGSCLLLMANGVFYYWGNLSVYCMSYFVFVLDSTTGVDSPWIFSIFIVAFTMGMFISKNIANRLGRRWTILLGSVIFNAGTFGSYFSVQNSYAALTFTIGVLMGAGNGFMNGSALQVVVDWCDKGVGMATALTEGSLSMGGLVVNQIITIYVNPRNLSPNFYLNPTKYFTQREVLDTVPSLFLVMGCVSVGLHAVAFMLIREREMTQPDTNYKTKSDADDNDDDDSETMFLFDNEARNNHKVKGHGSVIHKEKKGDACTFPTTEHLDYTCQQMMSTKSFFAMWTSFFLLGMPFLLSSAYYKTFGQIWIEDDYFITNIATILGGASMVMSVLWGMAMDRLGVKRCQVAFTALTALVLFWYYFSAMFSRWIFLAMTLALGCLSSPIYSCYTASTALLYGKKHFTTNFGVILTSQLVFNLISPYFVETVLTNFGWFATYAGTGVMSTIALGLIIGFIPNV